MANITKDERLRRDAERRDQVNEAKQSGEFGGSAFVTQQHQLDDLNEIDERKPDRRPGTVLDLNTQEPAPDNRRFAGDEGKALNQMVGRAAITENTDPQPSVTRANNPPAVADVHNRPPGEGDEIQLLRKYQPDHGQGAEQGIPHQVGEIVRVPSREAKRLVNIGAAKHTETD